MTATTHQSDANSARYFRTSNPEADFRLPNLWPDVTAWFDNSVLRYRQVLTEVLGDA